MKKPFTLIPTTISSEMVIAAEQLLTGVHDGEVIGFALVAMLREREYITAITGEARRNPTFSRGMVLSLDDELREMVHR